MATPAALAGRFGLHPEHTYAVVHGRDVATVVRLALTGVMAGRIVDVTDDAPVAVHEVTFARRQPIAARAESGAIPGQVAWTGRSFVDLASSRARRP